MQNELLIGPRTSYRRNIPMPLRLCSLSLFHPCKTTPLACYFLSVFPFFFLFLASPLIMVDQFKVDSLGILSPLQCCLTN